MVVVAAASCGGRTGLASGLAKGGGSTGGSGGVEGGCGKCPVAITCASKGLNCGLVGDGCGCILDCGTCTAPDETCGGGSVPNVCGSPCAVRSCSSLAFDCGQTGDGCDGTLSCGTCPDGQACGLAGTNTCGTGPCKTCADQGFECGAQDDGCGNEIDCGTCPTGTLCGGGSPGVLGVCGAPSCTPLSCTDQAFNCGMATDKCGNVIDCGSCAGNQICGKTLPNVCGASGECTGLCLQQVSCPTGTTSISGTVYAPQGTDPLYGVLVYVPNGPVLPFTPGVACGDCSAQVSGAPLVSAVTGVDGTFTIDNMPVGTNIPLVIQNGRWRRQFVIPSVSACVNTALPTAGMPQIRMPQTHLEGDIPLMGFVTGYADTLECVLRKIGIADSEFSDPGGAGRVQFYQGQAHPDATVYSASTPPDFQLWSSQAAIDAYDMVYFACQGAAPEQTDAAKAIILNYANAGGRIFATHYSYVWLYDNGPFSTTASWDVGQNPNFADDPGTGTINQTFPEGQALAQWLNLLYPQTMLGQIQISTLRHDFDGVVAPSKLWISDADPNYPTPVPMHYTFDTPVGSPTSQQCGRVLFDDFHVEDAMTNGAPFPQECQGGTAMTPQEKMLEFMIFDLGACVHLEACSASQTCAEQDVQCGPAADGCGNILQCGMCPTGQLCIGGQCTGCTPQTCEQQGFTCGAQDDGCGNLLACGDCMPNEVCRAGTCATGLCTPKTCTEQGFTCGPQGDGCGNLLQCGACVQGQICVAGTCQTPTCTPETCAQQGFDCGLASDGCNHEIDCGACTAPAICGAAKPNTCG
jgi:hypothetical protein